MKNYCLIVRYKDINEVQIIELNSRWYLDNSNKDIFYRKNSLEAIDLVTSRFKNREEMLLRMKDNGYIHSSDADVYIASKRKLNGKALLKIYEVIYNPKNDNRIAEFRDIAKASLANNFSSEREKVKRIFDKLAAKIFYNKEFREYLKSGFTNIYQQLMEMYVYSEENKPAYNIKYENYWVLSSYSTIRNIIEAMNRFDSFDYESDKVDSNLEFLNQNAIFRKKLEKELLVKLDKDYIEGQYNLFDLIENAQKVEEASGDNIDTKVNLDNEPLLGISIADKKDFIYNTLLKISIDVFKHDNDKIVINKAFFNNFSDKQDKKIFLNLENGIIRTLFLYVLHYEKYMAALNNFENTIHLEEELRRDRDKLSKIFAKERNVDKMYKWCRIYLKCLESKKNMKYQDILDEKEGEKIGKRH